MRQKKRPPGFLDNPGRKKIEAAPPERYAGQTGFTQTGDTTSDSIIPASKESVKGQHAQKDVLLENTEELGVEEDT